MYRKAARAASTLTNRFRALRFLIAGSMAAAVNLTLFFILHTYFDVWYLLAASMSFVFGFTVSFVLQKYWTYQERNHAHIPTQGTHYLALALMNLLINNLILYTLVEHYHMLPIVAQVVASVAIACETYFLGARIFRKRTTPAVSDTNV